MREDLPAASIERIREAFARYHLLLFRGQDITPEQQRRFAECFAPTIGTHQSRTDGLMFISNRDPETKVGEGTLPFHSDHTFFEEPDTSVLALYALAVPSAGGDTLWVDAALAYDDLPPALKARIVGLHALHAYKRSDKETGFTAIHPLARLLPGTECPVLFVNEFCKHGILELPGREGDELMAELLAHLYREGDFLPAQMARKRFHHLGQQRLAARPYRL